MLVREVGSRGGGMLLVLEAHSMWGVGWERDVARLLPMKLLLLLLLLLEPRGWGKEAPAVGGADGLLLLLLLEPWAGGKKARL